MFLSTVFIGASLVCWLAYFVKLPYVLEHGPSLKQPTMLHCSKQYFTHFYLFAAAYAIHQFNYATSMTVFLIHLIRRLVESACSHYSSSMFIGHYFVGFFHYYCAIHALLLPSVVQYDSGLYIFIFFMILQMSCHLQLIKAKQQFPDRRIPLNGFFTIFHCPHYTFEIFMYFGLCLYHCNPTTISMSFWVFSNLLVSMLNSKTAEHKWYLIPFVF